MPKGKVLVIDDSKLVQKYLSKMIEENSDLELVGVASNGHIGIQKIIMTKPDIVILDLVMNDGDGLFLLKEIEKNFAPYLRPFIILYSSRAIHGDPVFTKAIDFGFCDFILKGDNSKEDFYSRLKIQFYPKIASGIEAKKTRSLLYQLSGASNHTTIPNTSSNTTDSDIPTGLASLSEVIKNKYINPKILIIGASTGGPQVVRTIVNALNKTISIPVIIIQHMPENFTQTFAQELNNSSEIDVLELSHSMTLEAGKVYVFPGGMHGRVNAFGNLFVYYSERKNYNTHPFKPSINLAIEHLLSSFSGQAICTIISGMGSDGSIAAKKLHERGSLIVVQDKMSSAVWGMPGAVVKQKAADIILSQNDMGKGLHQILTHYKVMKI